MVVLGSSGAVVGGWIISLLETTKTCSNTNVDTDNNEDEAEEKIGERFFYSLFNQSSTSGNPIENTLK